MICCSLPEVGQLRAGDLEGCEEVDPVHDLVTGGRGQGAAVGGVGRGGAGDGGHAVQQRVQPEPGVDEGDLVVGVDNVLQSIGQGLQGGVVHGLERKYLELGKEGYDN